MELNSMLLYTIGVVKVRIWGEKVKTKDIDTLY